MSLFGSVTLRAVWRSLPMVARRSIGQALRKAIEPSLAAQLPFANPSAISASRVPTIVGVFKAALGHGTAARLLANELHQAGYLAHVWDITADVGADVNDLRDIESSQAESRGPIILAINPDTAIVALSGRSDALRDRPVIGYFVWELERCPNSWLRIGHAVNALWSPSRFSADALSAAFNRPVSVVPHPVALLPPPMPTPQARARGRAILGVSEDVFVALSSFSITSSLARKNPAGAIASFEAAFGASAHHKLVLRCLGGSRYPQALNHLRSLVRESKANVTLIDAPGGLEELHTLYAACDVVLALHRSEGFGLNLAEAMLSERAVIATGWSGNMDFMDDTSAALVDYKLIDVVDPQRIYSLPGARWAEPSLDSAIEHLRHIAKNNDERARLAGAGARMARTRLKGGSAAKALRPFCSETS